MQLFTDHDIIISSSIREEEDLRDSCLPAKKKKKKDISQIFPLSPPQLVVPCPHTHRGMRKHLSDGCWYLFNTVFIIQHNVSATSVTSAEQQTDTHSWKSSIKESRGHRCQNAASPCVQSSDSPPVAAETYRTPLCLHGKGLKSECTGQSFSQIGYNSAGGEKKPVDEF